MKRYTIHGVAASQGRELNNQPYTACEDPEGLWIKREDVEKEIKEVYEVAYFTGQNSNLNSCDGYMRSKHTVTAMAVSLHQIFHTDVATLRFKIKDSESLIIDIDQDAFEKFMKEPKRMQMTIKGQKIVGIGSWKMTTIPWYRRWWYWLKMRRIYGGNRW